MDLHLPIPGGAATAGAIPPRVRPLPPEWSAERIFRCLSRQRHVAFLDSAEGPPGLARYSYLTADPFCWHSIPKHDAEALSKLGRAVREYEQWVTPAAPPPELDSVSEELPPFQGGAVLLAAYDYNQTLDGVPPPRFDQTRMAGLSFGLYDVVVAIDHHRGRSWLISQGLPEVEPATRRRRAAEREAQFLAWLEQPPSDVSLESGGDCGAEWTAGTLTELSGAEGAQPAAPRFATWGPPWLTSNFSKVAYLDAVAAAVEYVRAGDVFQVNIAQTLMHPATCDSASLYCQLRRDNPAPFAAYFDLGDQQVLSASPERFLRVSGSMVEARPIKGTRPRRDWPEADLFAAFDLRTSAKDRAENVMIVDLMRNDLARVCDPDSIRVTQLCELESYAFVQHLVSAVQGRMPDGLPREAILTAAFPGGSVTGAPKIRAMHIISELEPTARGAYCGSLGYWSFGGELDLNILIRTITATDGWWVLPVGGGIVADSDPAREYEETWHKATGMLRPILELPLAARSR